MKLFETRDGSSSLLNEELNETYHSTHGAITESKYVYIGEGLKYFLSRKPANVSILEVGFGTGLNALLTIMELQNTEVSGKYTTLDTYPLPDTVLKQLNYGDRISKTLFSEIHSCPWNCAVEIGKKFVLHKIETALESFDPGELFDIVYFDAFAPAVQPEIWNFNNLEKTVNLMRENAVLITYCAQGNFRRNLEKLGLKVERLAGPPGKRHMVRAVKAAN